MDDDCDGLTDCEDVEDCLGTNREVCTGIGDSVDEDCDGIAGYCDSDCTTEEICFDDADQDCDLDDDDDDLALCIPDWDKEDKPAQGDCDEQCGACDGKPVHLLTRQAFVGPHEDVRLVSPQGGNFDIALSRVWDSHRAELDDTDDRLTGARTDQWPYPRTLGPGWRHSYDARLILEGDVSGDPISLLLSLEGSVERLFYDGTNAYGRVPGRAISATKSGSAWTVVDDDGTIYEFLEGTATKNHPAGNITLPSALEPFRDKSVQTHARLRTIKPRGVSAYRIRLWHEQDADAEPTVAPPGACTNVDLASGGCDPSRGLLVAVAAEWLDGSTWRRGASIELKYTVTTGTASTSKTQYLLTQILEGADRDESSSTPTILAEYDYATGTPSWREALTNVASCVGRTSGSSDISGSTCIADAGSKLFKYVPGTSDEAHLLAKVQRPARTTSGTLTVVDDEEFTWDDPGSGVYRVSAHLSAGIELSAPLGDDEPDGTMIWSRNGFTSQTTFQSGWPVERERCLGGACTTLSNRQPTFNVDPLAPNPLKKVVGNGLTVAAGGDTMTLRLFDTDGNVTHQVEVVPTGSTEPTMGVTTSGDVETVTVSGGITEIRRATRMYYAGSAPQRLIASATYTSRDVHNPSITSGLATRKFPTPAKADDSGVDWIFFSGSVTARPVPANSVALDSTSYYFDVDVFDADSGVDNPDAQSASNGLLNEAGEREVIWSHRVRTKPGGGSVARSSRVVVDKAGRTHWTFEHENNGGSYADELTLAKSTTRYTTVGSTASTRLRGRANEARQFPDATSSTYITSWEACASGAYDEHGGLACRVLPQTPTDVEVSESTATGPNGGRRTTYTTKEGSTVKLQRYEDHFPAGPVFESGAVGGNKTITSWSTSADATAGLSPVEMEEQDDNDTMLVKTANTYDGYGRLLEQTVENESNVLRRKTTYTYAFDDGTIEDVNRLKASPSTYVTRSTETDPASGRVLEVVEEDGDVITNVYATSGVDRGRLLEIERNGTSVQSFVYNTDGTISEINNGDESVAKYYYAEDGRLEHEVMVAAVVSSNTHNRTYADELVQIGGAGPYYRAQRITTKRSTSSTTTTIRDLRTISDHLGRPLRLCNVSTDSTCTSPVVQWFYENKCTTSSCTTDYTGTYTVEGTSRNVSLTNNNQAGRLSYVKHPAGTTFYEYDALGRPTLILTYEDPTLPAPGSLVEASMRAVQLEYYATTGELHRIRYPSGRKVEHRYGATGYGLTEDRRGPSEVLIYVDPNGVNTIHRIASRVQYDVDGVPIRWTWATDQVNVREHVRTRDLLGRITEIKDVSLGTTKTELDYSGYDDDGDLGQVVDQGPLAPILSLTGSAPQTWTFATDADRDMLTQWTDLADLEHVLALDADNGHRTTETVDGTDVYAYTYSGEWSVLRNKVGLMAHDFRMGTSTNGRAVFLDALDDTNYEVTSLAYGPRNDIVGYTIASAAQTLTRDESMKLWSRTSGTTVDNRYRYGPGGQLIDRQENLAGNLRDEYIYLAGMPIGVTHTDSTYPSPRSWWLSPDAQGIPRRVLERAAAMTQISRLVMTPWAQAAQTDDRSGWGVGFVALPFRHAGQLAELDTPHMIENRWRVYNPDLGVYLSPDPAVAFSGRAAGPQAYAYASGRPLVLTDPDGREIQGDPASMAAVAQVRANASLSGRFSLLDASSIIIKMMNVSRAEVDADGGAYTQVTSSHSPNILTCTKRGSQMCDDPDVVEVRWNEESANDVFAGIGNADYGAPLAGGAHRIVAHELGHVFWYQYCRTSGTQFQPGYAHGISYRDTSSSASLYWENCTRGSGPFRTRHNFP